MGADHSSEYLSSDLELTDYDAFIEVPDLNEPDDMDFFEGLAVDLPLCFLSRVSALFPLESKRYITRIRRIDSSYAQIIVSYDSSQVGEVNHTMLEVTEDFKVVKIKIPAWAPRNEQQFCQCNGAWPLDTRFEFTPPLELSCEPFAELIRELVASPKVFVCNPETNVPICCDICDCDNCSCHYQHGAIKALAETSRQNYMDGGYLCNGLDVFMTYEPCCMCMMAMVHSRVNRLFFIYPNERFGGCLSQVQMGYCKALNHHFPVFVFKRYFIN